MILCSREGILRFMNGIGIGKSLEALNRVGLQPLGEDIMSWSLVVFRASIAQVSFGCWKAPQLYCVAGAEMPVRPTPPRSRLMFQGRCTAEAMVTIMLTQPCFWATLHGARRAGAFNTQVCRGKSRGMFVGFCRFSAASFALSRCVIVVAARCRAWGASP